MIIDITKLKNQNVFSIEIDEKLEISEELLEKTNIIELNNVTVKGSISEIGDNDYELNVNVEGDMILPDSITLERTNYHFNTEIAGNIDELLEEIGETSKKTEFTIDIFPIIWENILMEIPMRVVSEEAKGQEVNMSGDGWSFTTGEEEKVSPLSELMDMLDDSEVR